MHLGDSSPNFLLSIDDVFGAEIRSLTGGSRCERQYFKVNHKRGTVPRALPVGATISISFTFFAPCFRNIGMFLEHGNDSLPHSLKIFVARAS
jgi:hypothetical protein